MTSDERDLTLGMFRNADRESISLFRSSLFALAGINVATVLVLFQVKIPSLSIISAMTLTSTALPINISTAAMIDYIHGAWANIHKIDKPIVPESICAFSSIIGAVLTMIALLLIIWEFSVIIGIVAIISIIGSSIAFFYFMKHTFKIRIK